MKALKKHACKVSGVRYQQKHNVRNTKYKVDTRYIAHRTWKNLHLTWYISTKHMEHSTKYIVPSTSYQPQMPNT